MARDAGDHNAGCSSLLLARRYPAAPRRLVDGVDDPRTAQAVALGDDRALHIASGMEAGMQDAFDLGEEVVRAAGAR